MNRTHKLLLFTLLLFSHHQSAWSLVQTEKNNYPVVNSNITEDEVRAAQEGWGKSLIQISQDNEKHGKKRAVQTANKVLDAAYSYQMGAVLFKPTLATGEQTFRTTREGALAYFVGQSAQFPGDSGFALNGWKKYEIKNAAVHISGPLALTMGNVLLTDKNGKEVKVDKTWGFKKFSDGSVRIVLHHSSLPYIPQ